jgi:hypothetical protein
MVQAVISVEELGYFNISNYAGLPGTRSVTVTGSQIIVFGIGLDRKLPYVTGNRWELSMGSPGVTALRSVDGYEDLATPAGSFPRCFRLKTEINSYDSGSGLTTTTGTFIWVAPNVGDAQYADISQDGTVTVTARLSSYSLGQ